MDDATLKNATSESDGPSRRDFLTRAGLFAGGMALLSVPGLRPEPVAEAAVDSRSFAAGSSALELDGQFVDVLKSVEGGFPRAEVVTMPIGPGQISKKSLGQLKFQDIAILCDPVMPKPLFDWVTASLTLSHVRKNGAIITTDFNRAEQSRLQFNNALITEFGIPTCDGASKDPGFLTVKFAPEITMPQAGKGTILPAVGAKQKSWSPSNFRLTIPGLDCSKVSKIE
ncbi:MAG: twin-arginine translocation signal domain-containing protein, partial [Nitrospiraceae bacterium]